MTEVLSISSSISNPSPLVKIHSQSTSTATPLRDSALRRQIPAELLAMRAAIDAAELNDEMTKQIDDWQKSFAAAYYTFPDAKEILDAHISLLQQILRDPLSGAPLDHEAVLGTDNHTYSPMTLSVYLVSAHPSIRGRSPLHIDQDKPFSIQCAHPVVQHMVSWLEKRGALLCSKEQEHIYCQVLVKQQQSTSSQTTTPEDREAKIARILKRKKALDEIEKKQKEMNSEEIEKEFIKRLEQHVQRLKLTFTSLDNAQAKCMQGPLKTLDATTNKVQPDLSLIEKKLNTIAKEEKKEREELKEEINSTKTTFDQRMATVKKSIDAMAQDPQSSQLLTSRIEALFRQGIEPLVQQIARDENAAKAKIQAFSKEDLNRLEALRKNTEDIRQQIETIKKSNQALVESEKIITRQLDGVAQRAADVGKALQKTEIAVLEARERQQQRFVNAIVGVAGSLFATWGLQYLLNTLEIGVQGAILPSTQGPTVSFVKYG